MTNQEAIELLEALADAASFAVRHATWAQAFLVEGGEPTWDAIKDVSRTAAQLLHICRAVEDFEGIFEEIIP